MIGALRHALAAAGHRASTTVAGAALGRMTPGGLPYAFGSPSGSGTGTGGQGGGWEVAARERFSAPGVQEAAWAQFVLEGGGVRPVEDLYKTGLPPSPPPPTPVEPWSYPGANGASNGLNPTGAGGSVPPSIPPLGYARAQFHETYIVSQTADGLVIVDQHAAHERLVYEAMKAEMARSGVRRQALLIPEIVELGEEGAIRIGERAEELGALGLEIEPFGPGAVLVRATPALFGVMDVKGLVRDLADELMEYDAALALNARFEHIMGNMACRSSVRAGRRLSIDEMNALLRAMEATPHSGQCNHGRPTYVELKRADIERLFGRK
jgi:DNA mismatch repair protein MutL